MGLLRCWVSLLYARRLVGHRAHSTAIIRCTAVPFYFFKRSVLGRLYEKQTLTERKHFGISREPKLWRKAHIFNNKNVH